jgi:hypothetical protein
MKRVTDCQRVSTGSDCDWTLKNNIPETEALVDWLNFLRISHEKQGTSWFLYHLALTGVSKMRWWGGGWRRRAL